MKVLKVIIFITLCVVAFIGGMLAKEAKNRNLKLEDINTDTIIEMSKDTVEGAKKKVGDLSEKVEESVKGTVEDVKEKVK